MADLAALIERLDRLIAALERTAQPPVSATDFEAAEAFLWEAERRFLRPISEINRVDLSLLKGIDDVRDILLANTSRFAAGLPPS